MSVLRYDQISQRLDGIDPETGILRGRATLAKEGVYRYSDGDRTWAEYVPLATLMDPSWIDSLKLAPVTLDHPSQMVTADNARALAVGGIGDSIVRLGDAIASPITVWARDAVDAAQTTHREISLGYFADVEERSGSWQGQLYDRVQTKRRANHVALVERGRHGPDVRLMLDSADMDPEADDETSDADETFTPPAEVAAAAKRGLELRAEQPPSNRGGTEVGLARARQLANREPVSLSTIKRMASFFARHEVDKKGEGWGKDSKGYQAWLLWGGDAGWAWAKSVIRKVEARGDGAAWQLRADTTAQEDAIMQDQIDALTAELAVEKARADKAEAERDELAARLTADAPAFPAEPSADPEPLEPKAVDPSVDAVCDMCGAPTRGGRYSSDVVKADALTEARARVELETRVRAVVAADYTCDGKDDRSLRLDALASLGVTGVDARSDDYLCARLDAALELRAQAQTPAAVIARALTATPAAAPRETLDANHLAKKAWH